MLHSSYVLLWVAFICITVIYIWPYVRRYVRWLVTINKIPGPSIIELIRFLCQFLFKGEAKDKVNYLQAFAAKHIKQNPLISVKIGPATAHVILCKPEAVKVLLSSKTQLEKATTYKYFDILLGNAILTSEVPKWHRLRKLITPAFNSMILDNFLQVMNEQADILVHTLELKCHQMDGGAFDIYPLIRRCAIDIICESAMGQRVDVQLNQDDDYIKASISLMDLISMRQFKPWLSFDWIYRFSSFKKVESRSLNVANRFTDEMIKNKRRQIAESKVVHGPNHQLSDEELGKLRLPFLELLLNNSLEDQEKGDRLLTDKGIRDEVNLFLLAAFHTMSIALNWALYYTGANPNVQQKIVDELWLVYGDCDRHSTSSDLHNLKYLECVIKETLRLNPPATAIGRLLTEDTNICGYTIPAGTDVFASIYWVHRDPAHYPDPDSFNPDRFLPENSQDRHPFAFIPFSAGPRNCIGQKFAMMELKVVLVSILRRFQVTIPDPDLKLKNANNREFSPSPDNRMQFKPRDI